MTDAPKPASVGDFAGNWDIHRRILDRMAGEEGNLVGSVSIRGEDAAFVYFENGILRLGTRPPLHATRQYLWTGDGTGIDVAFHDGREFHRIDLEAPEVEARHDCAPDIYVVRYEFARWPQWTSVWTVTGPRKNYVMTTDYTPGRH